MTPASDVFAGRATLEALELPDLRAVLATYAVTDLGRSRLLGLAPTADGDELGARRDRFREAGVLLADGPLVPSFEESLAPLLERLRPAAPAAPTGREVLALAGLLDASLAVVEAVRRREEPLEALAALAADLEDLRPLVGRIRRTLDRRGEVREDATPELALLRARIRRQREHLYRELQALKQEHQDHLSEDTIPVREGRLVLVLQAGAKGRVPGLVHGRSATGKSIYFEPLGVVDANNDLQEASEEEAVEKHRILAELAGELSTRRPAVEGHARFLAELDALQATQRWAVEVGAEPAEIAERHELRLVAARHPLLDPALAERREAALGAAGHRGPVVPLSVALEPELRALVITGPNAGGKTVALKTVGLLAVLHACGLPVPADRGSCIPRLDRVVATVGDEQDLLAETSTFSGRLLRLDEAWKGAGPGSLILLDELGSGTDPEEGAALAGALLTGLLERRALVVITTHLTPLAAEALEADGAYCAAMELDAATGRPTYRLLPGPPGGSEALALARRLGLDPSLVAAAEARLGPEGLDYRRLLGEVEALRQRLAAELERQTSARRDAETERDRLSAELRALEAARREAGKSLRQEHERFRREVRGRLAVEVDRLREELDEGRRKGLAARATDRLMAAAPELPPDEPEPEGELEPGAEVRHRSLGWTGVLKELDRGRAVVDVAGKTLRCRADELIPRGTPERSSAKRPAVQVEEASSGGVAAELDLLGERVAAALDRLDDYLDRALLEGRTEVRIVHGHGTGRLREAVRAHLRGHPAVASWRPGERGEGGNGATVVTLA